MNCEDCVIWKKYFEGETCIFAEDEEQDILDTGVCFFDRQSGEALEEDEGKHL